MHRLRLPDMERNQVTIDLTPEQSFVLWSELTEGNWRLVTFSEGGGFYAQRYWNNIRPQTGDIVYVPPLDLVQFVDDLVQKRKYNRSIEERTTKNVPRTYVTVHPQPSFL